LCQGVAKLGVLKTEDMNKDKLPLGAKACCNSSYLDDNVAACEFADTKQLYKQLMELFSLTGTVVYAWLKAALTEEISNALFIA
jgi:hypothetical protein